VPEIETEVILHLGAHKTASTHLQQALNRAAGRLAARGVAVWLPEGLRRDGLRLQDWLGLAGEDRGHEAQLRAAFAAPAARLVISEENALGQCPGAELVADPMLYPRAGERLARLLALVPPGPLTLALALREGAGLVASCYSQALMAGRPVPFQRMFGGLDPARLDWADLVGRLRAAAPGARLLVWDHADWPAVAPQVARALLGPEAAHLVPSATPAHPGLSAAAVARLLAEAPADPQAARDLARRLRAELDKTRGHAPFDPWAAPARARAARAHAQALARLAAMPGVTLLRPAAG